ncbi:MAG TPA: DUF748 domain-containing protein, partial [Candidatus Tectomicrobia bacterium]|nr:DUF748 domain-containing protein [Candidatus Tectomicrobia bacterium]
MSGRRWAALILGIVVIAAAVTVHALPELVRRLAVARLEAITQRPASIERVDLDLLRGRATVHGFRLAEREGSAPFVDFQRLDVRVRLPWLLVGHLWLRQVVLTDSTVHVLRLPTGDFNFSDLIRQSGSGGRALDVTVDRFALLGGTVTLEDRALPEPRTWVSEQISIEAHDLSTRRDDGRAIGRSVTGGAPVSVEVRNLRLYPIRLHATVAVENLDLAPAQVYVPPDAPFVLERGRASTSITVALDAREGIRVDATGRLDDVTLVSRDGGQRLARVPTLTTDLAGFTFREGADLRLERLALDGTVSVRDPRVTTRTVFRDSTVRARVTDLTWPATTPGHVDISTTIPGGGTLAVTGAIQPPPAASRLRLRLAGLDLAPWTQFLPVRGRVTGVAEADLRMNEPLAAGIPARLQGSIAVTRLALADDRRQVLGARRVEASGIEVHWPSRVVVERVLLTGPRATVERDRTGAFPVTDLVGGSGSSPTSPGSAAAAANGPTRAADGIVIDLGELAVRDGAIAWRDEAVSPVARLDVSSVNGSVTGVGWPVRGPAAVRLSLRP